jgi:hypothetical protein
MANPFTTDRIRAAVRIARRDHEAAVRRAAQGDPAAGAPRRGIDPDRAYRPLIDGPMDLRAYHALTGASY